MWEKLWRSAVINLAIQPSEAWQLTPKEFWSLWDARVEMSQLQGGGSNNPLTRSEYDQMLADFEERGLL